MSVQQKVDEDLKTAMLAGDKQTTEALRVIKSVLQNEAISSGARDTGLEDTQAVNILQREAKKRREAAELYEKAGEMERTTKEKFELTLIEKYLPAQASQEEIASAVEAEIAKLDSPNPADMGKIIGAVRSKLGPSADSGAIALAVKDKLS